MSIKQKIQQREKFLKDFYPVADDKVRKKTNAELEMKGYKLHYYFIRFAFAVLSFFLYVPTIIELFQNSFVISDYIRNFIIVLILLLLEIGLSFSLYDYYVRWHSNNANRRRIIVYSLAFASIILSALSGVNAIDIVDKSEDNIISETRTNQAQDVNEYLAQIERNTHRITKAHETFNINNENIKDLAPIAATQKGSEQIAKFQKQNDRLQIFTGKWINQNNHNYKVIENIRKENKSMMKTRITKAGKKELIYMIIFFFTGIIAVGGLMYSYNFIGQYYRYVKDDANEIAVLKKQFENEEREDKKGRLKQLIEEKELETQLESLENPNNNGEDIIDFQKKKLLY